MTAHNCITVALGAAWQIYSNTIPPGSRALGTVTRGIGDTGVLVLLDRTGLYAQVNAGAMRSLPQSDVAAAIGAARSGSHGGAGRGQGRKAADGATYLQRVNITLDPECDAIARRAGVDRSTGIRAALRFWARHHAATPARQSPAVTPRRQKQITYNNMSIISQHWGDIMRMEADRLPRSQICLWLEARGADFGGKATALNTLLGPRSYS